MGQTIVITGFSLSRYHCTSLLNVYWLGANSLIFFLVSWIIFAPIPHIWEKSKYLSMNEIHCSKIKKRIWIFLGIDMIHCLTIISLMSANIWYWSTHQRYCSPIVKFYPFISWKSNSSILHDDTWVCLWYSPIYLSKKPHVFNHKHRQKSRPEVYLSDFNKIFLVLSNWYVFALSVLYKQILIYTTLIFWILFFNK